MTSGSTTIAASVVLAALNAIQAIVPGPPVHACGYCLGGTILAIAAATLARQGSQQLASLTLLAAQTDFSEAGELMLFIDESQIALSRGPDVGPRAIWTRRRWQVPSPCCAATISCGRGSCVRSICWESASVPTDFAAWNSDETRLPARMHVEYLKSLFLENRFSRGRYAVEGRPVALTDIRTPIFAVATERDHIAPWQSVYKIRLLSDTDVTFVLASGGHNVGIVSPPGRPNRHYPHHDDGPGRSVSATGHLVCGSPPARGVLVASLWQGWLAAASGRPCDPPRQGAPEHALPPLMPAPGSYVLET